MSDAKPIPEDDIRGLAVLSAGFKKPRMDGTGVSRQDIDDAERKIRADQSAGDDATRAAS